MEKRFIYGKASEWNANKVANEEKFANSIVFIKNDGWNGTTNTKGDAIFAQGAYFEMNNTTDVENIIKNFLNGKGKGNIKVEVDTNGNLTISETSIASLTGKTTSTELVQAKAVASALTTPVSLVLTPSDDATVYTFTETFKKLDGSEDEIVTAVFKEGNYIDLTNDGGLKISVNKAGLATDLKTDLNYGNGNVITVDNEKRTINHNEVAATTKTTGTAINPTSDAKSFDIKSYGFDKYGHISSETTTTVTLPDNAFKNDNTTYDLGTTANATKGVDVNLSGNDTTTDTVTFVGGSNVEVALKDGKVEISSSYVNDNTTYTGENAIVVTQPEEGKTEGKVTLKIDESDLFLSQSGDGLKANIEVAYDNTSNFIYLKGVGTNDKTVGFDASVFVKDSFLKNVEIVEENAEKVKGNYLKFTFQTVDTDGVGEVDEKVIYVDIKDFYVKTTVSGDDATYSSVVKTGDDYKVSNVLGTISRDNDSNTITVGKAGLATVGDIKAVLETIDSNLDAVKAEGANKDEIAVVTGITQVDGKITSVDSGLAATKDYVAGVILGLDSDLSTAAGAPTSGDSTNGSNDQMFTKIVINDGKLDVTHSKVANVDNAKLVDYTTTSTQKYVGITTELTIAQAFAKLEESWDWGTIVTA